MARSITPIEGNEVNASSGQTKGPEPVESDSGGSTSGQTVTETESKTTVTDAGGQEVGGEKTFDVEPEPSTINLTAQDQFSTGSAEDVTGPGGSMDVETSDPRPTVGVTGAEVAGGNLITEAAESGREAADAAGNAAGSLEIPDINLPDASPEVDVDTSGLGIGVGAAGLAIGAAILLGGGGR